MFTLKLDSHELSYVDWDQQHILEAGTFDIMLGFNSRDLQTKQFELID